MGAFIDWIIDRLREPSTWQGITVIATTAGISVEPQLASEIAKAGASIFGLIYVVKKG